MSSERLRQVVPLGVRPFNQLQFPRAIPTLDVFLAINRHANIAMDFVPNENVDAVALGESRHEAGSVLERASNKIVGDAGVERSVTPTGENIDVVGVRLRAKLVGRLKLARKIWVPFPRIAHVVRDARRG